MVSAEAWEALEACIIVWGIFTVVAYAAAVVWWLVRVDWRASVSWSSTRAKLAGGFEWCRAHAWPCRRREWSPIDVAAHKLVRERTRQISKLGLYAMAPLLALVVLFMVSCELGLISFEFRGRLGESHALVSSFAPLLAALSACRQDQPGKGVVMVLQASVFCALSWTCYNYRTGLDMLFDRSTTFGIRFVMAMMLSDVKLTVALNSGYSALMMYKFHSFASTDEDIAHLGVPWFATQELFAVMSLTAAHLVMLWRMETDARNTLQAKASMNFISGLSTLLKTSYDVVVELTDTFTFVDEPRDLASLLLHGPHRSLKGSSFADLMAEDADKEAFSTHMTKPSADAPLQCSAIPHLFRMRDSDSNVLWMELWHTRLEDLDSRARHLVGIKERGADGQNSRGLNRQSQVDVMPPPRFSGNRRSGRPQEGKPTSTQAPRQSRGSARGGETPTSEAGEVRDDGQQSEGGESQQVAPGGDSGPKARTYGRSADDESSVISSNASAQSHTYLVEGFRRTTVGAQRTALLHLLTTWNIPLRRAGCCPYHGAVNELKTAAKALGRAQCNPFDVLAASRNHWQCPTCGILAPSHMAAQYDYVTRNCSLCRDENAPPPGHVAL